MDSWFFLPFPRRIDSAIRRSGKGEEPSGESPPPDSKSALVTPSLAGISPTRQTNSPQAQVTDSSSVNEIVNRGQSTNLDRLGSNHGCNSLIRLVTACGTRAACDAFGIARNTATTFDIFLWLQVTKVDVSLLHSALARDVQPNRKQVCYFLRIHNFCVRSL